MPTFSQGFLSNLGKPAMTQSLFDLGTAVGQLPQQRREQQRRSADASSLENLGQAQKLRRMAEMAARDGDMQRAAQLEEAATKLERRRVVEGREDVSFEQGQVDRQRQLDKEAAEIEGKATGVIQMAKAAAEDKSLTQVARDAAKAILKRAEVNPGDAGALESALQKIISQGGKYQNIGGKYYLDRETGKMEAPEQADEAEALDALTKLAGKFTAESLGEAIGKDGSVDISKLRDITKPVKPAGISSVAEKEMVKISGKATEADLSIARNDILSAELQGNAGYTGGFAGELRTRVTTFAGLRDATEEQKTAFIRERNQALVQGLPPGVASDRDIDLVKSGLPPDNAGREEVLAYLQAERMVLHARKDLARVAEGHLSSQSSSGSEATLVGYDAAKAAYGNAMRVLRGYTDALNGLPPEEYAKGLEKVKGYAVDALGFVPSYMVEL